MNITNEPVKSGLEEHVSNHLTPPHDANAEQAVLGSLLLDWNSAGDVMQVLKAHDFYSLQNQLVYDSLLRLYAAGTRGDILTLADDLTKRGKLDEAGGVAYLSAIVDAMPTSVDVLYYTNIVLDQSARRRLIGILAEIKADSFDKTKEIHTVLEDAEKKIFALTDYSQSGKIHEMHDAVTDTVNIIDTRYKNKNEFSGIASGLQDLDVMTSGFQKSEMIIIGSRPSMGKTALALSMMQNIAIEKRIPCGFFNLESSLEQTTMRLLAQVARVSGTKLRNGSLKIEDFKRLQDAAGVCYDAPLYVVDTPNMRLLDLRAIARRMKVEHEVKIIFIDHIGLIADENPDTPIFEQQLKISRSLKSLARELEIPLVVLCQLNRDAVTYGLEPRLEYLRGSGSIEEDADVVILIHGKQNGLCGDDFQERKLIIAKQRNGSTGDVNVLFLPKYAKFENGTNDEQEN